MGILSLRKTPGPLVVEVLAPSLVGAGLPRVAADARRTAAPGSGEIGGDEAYRLLGLLDRLRQLFGGRIVVHIIEPFSLTWIVRVVRHRPRRFPLFVIGSRTIVAGIDEAAVTDQIAALLPLAPSR